MTTNPEFHDPHQPIEFRSSRLRLVLLTLVSIVFVLIGLGMIVAGGVAMVIGIVCVLFFGFGVFSLGRQVLTREPALRLDPKGLHLRGHPTVPWNEIIEYSLVEINRQPMIGIHVRDEDALLAEFSSAKRALAVANREIAGTVFTVAQKNCGASMDELINAIEVRRQAFGTPG